LLNIEKIRNKLYAHLKTDLNVDVVNPVPKPKSKPIKIKNIQNVTDISHRLLPNKLAASMDLTRRLNKSETNENLRSSDSVRDKLTQRKPAKFETVLISKPYVSEIQMQRNEFKKNKERWVVKNDFNKFAGKATKPVFIKNYINLIPSEPPINYQFRSVDKKRWVAPTNFFI
jgi:hypothetical protein